MIVTVTCPNNVAKVRYGVIEMMPDASHHLDVPDYVAKTLVTLPGFTCPADLTRSISSLLTNRDAAGFEKNYLFQAYNQQPSNLDTASALLTERGEPAASFS